MTTPFSTTALLSFYGWLDHQLLQAGGMFQNVNTQLYPQDPGSKIGGAGVAFAAPFRSMVWDTSISGANQFSGISGYLFNASQFTSSGGDQLYSTVYFPQIPTTGFGSTPLQLDLSFPAYVTIPSGTAVLSGNSVFFPDNLAQTGAVRFSGAGSGSYTDVTFSLDGSPTVILRGQYGLQTDFENGRILVPAGVIPAGTPISGSYAVKDFNLYFANQIADRMVFTDKPYLNSRFNRALSGMPPPHERVTPAVFISDSRITNTLVGLGGVYDTRVDMRLDVWAENLGQLENVLSLMRDSKDLCFPELTAAQWPLALSGDYKGPGYSYLALFQSGYTPANLYSITKVRASKGSDRIKLDEAIFVGRVDMTLVKQRRLR